MELILVKEWCGIYQSDFILKTLALYFHSILEATDVDHDPMHNMESKGAIVLVCTAVGPQISPYRIHLTDHHLIRLNKLFWPSKALKSAGRRLTRSLGCLTAQNIHA